MSDVAIDGWARTALVPLFGWELPTGREALLLGTILTAVSFVGSLVAVIAFVVKLPADYFVDHRRLPIAEEHPVLRLLTLIGKNILGLLVLALGIVFLFTPGQGVLCILIGIMLLNFPGKRRLEKKLVSRPRVLRAINRLRQRFGKPPLVFGRELARVIQEEEAKEVSPPCGP